MADSTLGTAVLRTRLDRSGLKTGLNQAKGDTQKFATDSSTAIRGIGAAFGAIVASQGVRSYISFLRTSANLAVQADAANRLFEKSLQRTNQGLAEGAGLVDRLSTRFGVANSVIESSATLLLRQGASLDDIERALTAAGASAAAAGFDISTAFDNVAIAVATGRSELLETSGIVTNLGPVTQDYAKSIGKTVDELTEQEVIQARVNAIYRETASEIEDVDEILQGLPIAQAEVTKGWRTFREDVGGIAEEVITPLTAGLGAVLGYVNDLPEPVKRAGVAMSGAALGATALATGVVAIRAALTGFQALGLVSFGPAGWIVLGVTAVAGLVAVLSGRQDSLDKAIGDVNKALAGSDTDSLVGALDQVIAQVDGPTKTSLQGLQDELRTTGDVGVEMAERIHEALTQAATAPLRAELEIVRTEAAQIERLLGTVQSPDAINTRIAEIESQGNALLDSGQEVPLSLVNELTLLRGLAEGIELSTANSTRDQERLNRLREREAQLLKDIEAASGPGINVPGAAPPPANQPPPTNTGGSTTVPPPPGSIAEVQALLTAARAELRLAVTDEARIAADMLVSELEKRLRNMTPQQIVIDPTARVRTSEEAAPTGSGLPIIGLPDSPFSNLRGEQASEAARLRNTLDDAVQQYVDELEERVRATTPRPLALEGLRAVLPDPRALTSLAFAQEDFSNFADSTAELQRFINTASQIDLATTNADRAARDAALLAIQERELAKARAAAAQQNAVTLQVFAQQERFGSAANRDAFTRQALIQSFGITPGQLAFGNQMDARQADMDRWRRRESGEFGDGGLAEADRINRERERQRQADQNAADQFANTVVSAGFAMGDAAIKAIADGDIPGLLRAGLSGAGSILGGSNLGSIGFLGGSIGIGALISGGLGILGTLIGVLAGGGRSDADQAAAQQRRVGNVPAININFEVNQTNTYQGGPSQPENEQAFRRQAGIMFEELYRRHLGPRLDKIENRLGIGATA